jgi:hypothetical protein
MSERIAVQAAPELPDITPLDNEAAAKYEFRTLSTYPSAYGRALVGG